MADEGELSYQELEANLAEYSGQLKQVEGLLLGDPENGELSEMYDSLTEVIQLTTELLSEARAQHAADTAAAAGGASGSAVEISLG
ncbi:hypothetical protein FOA52_013639 [Chlamydomonas sp. UWO 241]|nr:hypothetical protein FOA52_013639 [Chlamydomonas sp. UWO 241]